MKNEKVIEEKNQNVEEEEVKLYQAGPIDEEV